MTENGKTILVAINDIFFYTKLRDALSASGYRLERARAQDDVPAKAAAMHPAALVVNMNDERLNALEAIEAAKAVEGLSALPVLAFANHEEIDTFRRAKELGVTKIVSRNEFSARTRELVDEVVNGKQ